jgi:N-acyl-L-homoserine lactone synthetase
MSFNEFLSQQEDSTKEKNNILDNIDRKRISNFNGFGKFSKTKIKGIDFDTFNKEKSSYIFFKLIL